MIRRSDAYDELPVVVPGTGTRTHCPFCRIAGTPDASLPDHDRPLSRGPEFLVVPALGPLVEGYLLVTTVAHVANLSSLPARTRDSLAATQVRVADLLRAVYGRGTVFFEHGPVAARPGGSCIDHAHLHGVPVEVTVASFLQHAAPWLGRVTPPRDAMDLLASGRPYFSFESHEGERLVLDATNLPCQFGRRVLASLLGQGEAYDWAVFPHLERMRATRRLLTMALAEAR